MNWVGNLVQKEVSESDTVLYLGCGIMQDVGNKVDNMYFGKLRCKFIVGVDIWRQYLEHIKNEENVIVLNLDIRDLSMFIDKSFDVVIALDTVEHLEEKDSYKVIKEMERIAKKKVIILTPFEFYSNVKHTKEHYPYCGLGDNPFMEHKCIVTYEWFEKNGFIVKKVTANIVEPVYYSFAVKVIK